MANNPHIPGFQGEEECLADLERLRQGWDGRMGWLREYCSGRPPRMKHNNHARHTIAAWMITCPEREKVRKTTLEYFAATDWGDAPLHVLVDPKAMAASSTGPLAGVRNNKVQQISAQVLHALQQFLDHPAEYLLLLEDDLCFNRHMRHNIERWRPFRQREITLAGLYNPGLRELAFDVRGHAIAVIPELAFGTQALLLSRPTVEHVVSGWNTSSAAADMRLMSLARQLKRPLYYHSPSLVQHREVPSTWGGRAHFAPDFDPEWRA